MKSVCRVLLPTLLLMAVCCSAWLPAAFEPDRPIQANDAIPAGPPESGLLTLPDLPSWLDIAGASVFTPPSGRNNGQVHASAFPRTANHEPGTALCLPENRIGGRNLPGPASHPAEPGLSRTSHWAYPVGPGKYTSGSLAASNRGMAETPIRYQSHGDPAEFARQLAGQEAGINKMTAGEIKANIEKFMSEGRPSSATSAIRAARRQNPVAAQGQAGLHNPDCCVGGNPIAVESFGGISENSSLGAQNRAQMQAIYNAVKSLPPDTKVNFKFIVEPKR